MFSSYGALPSCCCLRMATWLPKSRMHFSYIRQRIIVLSANDIVNKCPDQRMNPSASMTMRDISKSMSCDPPVEWAFLCEMSISQYTTFHSSNVHIDTVDVIQVYPPPIKGALIGCMPPNWTYSMTRWPTSSPLAVGIPLPICCAAGTTNCFTMLNIGTTLCGSV